MGTLGQEIGEIHLPERWAVLEQALRELNAQGDEVHDKTAPKGDGSGEGSVVDTGDTHRSRRNRDARDS